jgi:hypothetical protein
VQHNISAQTTPLVKIIRFRWIFLINAITQFDLQKHNQPPGTIILSPQTFAQLNYAELVLFLLDLQTIEST